MRLGSWLLTFAFLSSLSSLSRADNTFILKTQLYIDNNDTIVISPLVALTRDAWTGATLSAHYVADAITSASIDVVSNATKRMADFRSEVGFGLSQRIKMSTLSGGYTYSVEHDYQSHGFELGLSQDLFQRNTTLAFGYGFTHNDIGRANDALFHRTLDVNGASVTLAQTLGTKMVGSIGYTFSYLDGYQASPYRFVKIEGAQGVFKVAETLPGVRVRHAATVGLRRHLFRDTAIHLDYRLYLDNWGVAAQTVQLAYFVRFGDLTLRIKERFYYQDGASFFRTTYSDMDLPPYVTADKELSTLWSNVAGIKLEYRLPIAERALSLEAKVDFFYFGYINYALLSSRYGADISAGLTVLY